jgi:hypothetical protein
MTVAGVQVASYVASAGVFPARWLHVRRQRLA